MTKLLRAAPWLFAMALAVQPLPSGAEPLSFQEQRLLMRQMTQRLQTRLEQRLRCIDRATTNADLRSCQTSTDGMHGMGAGIGGGMGAQGWGCPMW